MTQRVAVPGHPVVGASAVERDEPAPLPLPSQITPGRLPNRLWTLFRSSLLIWLAIWSLALVAWMPRHWDEGFGALPLIEDRMAILSLTVLAAVAGVCVRSWYWPPAVAASWIALVGASQLWMLNQVGTGSYLDRWRVIAPLFVGGSLFDHGTYRFGQSDLLALVIAGAALPALGAIIGVAARRRHEANSSDVAVLATLTFAGLLGFMMMAASFPLGSFLLPLLGAPIAGAVVRRWACVLGMPLAWAYGGFLWMALGLSTHGVGAEWHRSVIVGEEGILGPNRLTFWDGIQGLTTFAAVVILPAGLLGMVMARLTTGFAGSWGRRPR